MPYFVQHLSVKMRTVPVIFILVCSLLHIARSYKILGVTAIPTRSHHSVTHALMKGLADEGHHVTVISPFKLKKPIKNYKEIYLESNLELSLRGMIKFESFDSF